MSLRSNSHLKLVGIAGASALAIGAIAAPAVAAGEESASVAYTCSAGGAGSASPSATFHVNQPPATMVAGQTVKLGTTSEFTLDAATTGLATGLLGWHSFSGKVTTTPSASKVGLSLAIAKTVLANNGDGSTTAPASGNTLLRASKAGTYTLKLGDIGKVHLQGYDASDNPSSTVDFPNASTGFGACKNNAGTTTLMNASSQPATVKVSKDSTRTAVTAAYSTAKKQATGTAKVKSHFGLRPTGKVVFTLKRGTHKVATMTKTLKAGAAKAVFKNVTAKGKYSISTKYAGNAALKGSTGKASFTVK